MNTTTVPHSPDLSHLRRAAGIQSRPTVSQSIRESRILLAVAAAAATLLFWPTLVTLWDQWMEDPDFSHGIVIVGVSVVLIYAKRDELGALTARRSLAGLAFLILCILLYAAGHRSMTRIVERLAVWGTVVGSLWFLFGARFLLARPFPYFYLLLCIPPPFFILNPVRLALKTFATRLSSDVLVLIGIPALPEGNVLTIGDARLEVADACSGIRSLMAVTATAVLFAYLFRMGISKGALLTAMSIPITVLVNVLRLVVVAVALTRFEIDLTSGWPHDMVGFAVFGISLVLLFGTSRFIEWFFHGSRTRQEDAHP